MMTHGIVTEGVHETFSGCVPDSGQPCSVPVLDLFSAACGGWSLGMHRAGFTTMAACEAVDWRRAIYAQNNPGIRIYDDVRTLTAERLLRDIGYLPRIIVGSPPCQDISSANTSGKGVDGERSGLFFEAVRIIGECRPRWFALENSANLRTRGADRVIAALAAINYTCWPFVVGADDCGANHERKRSWLIGCDLDQIADTDSGQLGEQSGWWNGSRRASASRYENDDSTVSGDAAQDGCGQGFPGRRAEPASRAQFAPCGDGQTPDVPSIGRAAWAGDHEGADSGNNGRVAGDDAGDGVAERNTPNPDQARQAHGCVEPGIRQAEIADDGCGDGRSVDGPGERKMGVCPTDRSGADGPWPLWSLDDLAGRLRLDDGLPARVAGTRIAVGGPRGTVAASLIVEAYGDAVIPQIPEAIGRAILRTEAALRAASPSQRRGGGL